MSDLSSRLGSTASGRRARPAEPPSRESVEKIARELEAGTYRVDAARVAEAILSGKRPPRRPG